MALENYASIIQAGANLVPDLRAQSMQDRQLAVQESQAAVQRQAAMMKAAEAQQQVEGRAALERALLSGNPQELLKLMAKYPAISEQVKPLWEAMDKNQRQATLTQAGTIYARAQSGDMKGAAAALRARVEADREVGQVDPEDEAILAGLESDNPVEQRAAMQMIGVQIAAIDPDKFAETYGKLNPSDSKTTVQKEYEWRVGQFGQRSADQWLATQDTDLVTVDAGGSVFRKSDFAPQTKGGDPASGGGGGAISPPPAATTQATAAIDPTGPAIEQAALSVVPGLTVTSRQRSAAKNRAVGGVGNSYHLTDQARDFVPPKGMPMGVLWNRLKKAMPGFDVLNEGDHVHVEPAGSRQSTGPTRIASKQQYEKLAPGTPYIAPDGSRRVKQ